MNSNPSIKTLIRPFLFLLGMACVWFSSNAAKGQTLYDTFSDGNFTASPVWGGNTALWTIVANSDAAAGATGSNTLRLNSTGGSTDYLSSQAATWGVSQEWGVWIGRRAQAFTAANQAYVWLYANESTLNNATVDGYRLAIGDDTGNDEIRLEYVVNGAVSATVITSTGALTNGITDVGFLVRVTRSSSGAWALFTSTLPTANGAGAIATDVPNSTNATVSQGTGTNNTLSPAANGYLGVATLHSTGANAIVASEFDQFYFTASTGATITGAATASAFTTTYGTASTAQTFSVSGASLTADLVATAPTGFEVASDGATYGGTATFTQSGGSASGTLSVRLKSNAAVTGSYNSQNIVLSTTGATSVNIVTAASGNAVSAQALSITASAQSKTYGSTLSLGTSLFSSSGLVNSETIGSVTLVASGGTAATDAATTYTITPSAATGGTFTASNYSITYNTGTLTVDPKALTITANDVTKPYGNTLSSPVVGSTAFTSIGLANSETIGSVTITYGTGAAAGDAAGSYPGQVTPSSAVDGTFNIANYTPTYVAGTITVTADPTITVSGSLTAVDTTYGTASPSPTSFSVSGIFLTGDLTVTPPSGFEVSTSLGSGYTTSLTVPASGTLNSTTVYVRLAATTAFGTYSGNITVSGGGASSKTVATAASSVAKKGLTITGLTGNNKPYDQTTTASLSGTPAYSGLENGDSFSVSGTASASFATAGAGTAKPITVTGYTEPSTNYTITQPTGITGDITPVALAITAPSLASKVYNGNATAGTLTVGTLSGFVGTETVTASGSAAAYSSANVGSYPGTVITYTLNNGTNGGLASNYSLASGAATGAITAKALTVTATNVTKNVGSTLTGGPGSTAFTSTGLVSGETIGSVTIAYGSGAAAGDAVGTYTGSVTASAATGGTFLATNYTITYNAGDIIVTVPLIAGWDFQTTTNGGTAIVASPNSPTAYTANFGTGTIYLDGTNGSSSWSAATELNGFAGTATNAASGFSTTTTTPACLALLGGSSNSANGKKAVFKFSMTGHAGLVVSYATQKTSTGFDTHLWEYSTDGSSWTTAETVTSIPTSFGTKSLATINGLNGAVTAYLRLTVSGSTGSSQNNRIDNVQIRAADASGISATGTPVAFTTTYGTASASQTFSVSGVNLTADITATAPTGFEVSNGGAYGPTTTFTQSSGTASGTLSVRLTSTAVVAGSYNSQNIVLSSTGATSVNITTTASGNIVSKATPSINTAPTASNIVHGQTLADSILSGGSASVAGTFAFTTPSTAPAAGTAGQSVTFTPSDASNYDTAATSVSVTVISVYDDWASHYAGFTDTDPTHDPDFDGISNRIEFAFGTDPTASSAGPITYASGAISANGQPTIGVTMGGDFLAVFGRRKDYVAAGLTYTVQFSSNLVDWVDSTETPTGVASDAKMDALSVPFPLPIDGPKFFRVSVSAN